jgi:hypothetical protein
MDPLQDDPCLPDDGANADRGRRTGLERTLVCAMRSKWVAMFIVAFAVSWSFHQVDEVSQHRLEREQHITQCTIAAVADAQSKLKTGERVIVRPILQACEKQVGK